MCKLCTFLCDVVELPMKNTVATIIIKLTLQSVSLDNRTELMYTYM